MRLITILTLVCLSACASSPTIGAGRSTETVRGITGTPGISMAPSSSESAANVALPLDQIWRVMPAVYQSLGVALTTLDQKTHVIGNEGFKIRKQLGGVDLSKYIECGTTQIGPNADSYEVHFTLLTQLLAGPGGTTTVTTTLQAASRPLSFAQDYSRCSSKGVLEPKIVQMISAKLQK